MRRVTEYDIFTQDEVRDTADFFRDRAKSSHVDRLTLLVWNLSCCAGLRASEIAGIRISDVALNPNVRGRYKPNIFVPASVAKRGAGQERSRRVPLTWCPWLLEDLRQWWEVRQHVPPNSPDDAFAVRLGGVWRGRSVPLVGKFVEDRQLAGATVDRYGVRQHFMRACRLMDFKSRRCTTHTGRHTFCSHALAAGYSMAQVRDAAGHATLKSTDVYTHVVDSAGVDGKLYARQTEGGDRGE